MLISYTTNTTLDKDNFRIISVVRLGSSDAQTPDEVSPFGIDSNPIDGIAALVGDTGIKGESACFGYYQTNRLAAKGETRLYSSGANKEQKFYIWLKADGTCEIGGADDNMVRYSKLETAFNNLKNKVNDHISKYNSHTHIYSPGGGSPTATAATTATETPSTADITPAKIEQIKTMANDSI